MDKGYYDTETSRPSTISATTTTTMAIITQLLRPLSLLLLQNTCHSSGEYPNFSNAGTHARSIIGLGPHKNTRVELASPAPVGGGMCAATISTETNPLSNFQPRAGGRSSVYHSLKRSGNFFATLSSSERRNMSCSVWLAKISENRVVSEGSLSAALITCRQGVIPVPLQV